MTKREIILKSRNEEEEILMKKFSHDEYIRLVGMKKNLWDKPEEEYKEKFIPVTLYKYWSFSSTSNI